MITSVMMEMPGSDEWFMRQAMKESRKALVKGEVPVGAIVVKDGRVIGRGWNQVETLKDATAHAEMIALTAAQEALGDWRLEGCTLYVTKEPCPMCAGAIVHCRPDRVVFGCPDAKTGAAVPAYWETSACFISRSFSVRRVWRQKNGKNCLRVFLPLRMKTGNEVRNKTLCICQSSRVTAS